MYKETSPYKSHHSLEILARGLNTYLSLGKPSKYGWNLKRQQELHVAAGKTEFMNSLGLRKEGEKKLEETTHLL